jgi:hypothetical protein
MRIACEVQRVLSSKPNQIQPDQFKIKFERKESKASGGIISSNRNEGISSTKSGITTSSRNPARGDPKIPKEEWNHMKNDLIRSVWFSRMTKPIRDAHTGEIISRPRDKKGS